MFDRIISSALLALAKLTRRALWRIAQRNVTAGLYLQAAGVDVDRLSREPVAH